MSTQSSTLQILIQAKDEASEKIKGLGDQAKKMEPAFKNMALYGGVAFTAIAGFAVSATKAAAEAETAQNQLEHAVLNVSHATKAQLQATMDLADELERKGVLDGDNIKVGLAQLSTFGLSNKAVQGLGKSLSDLSVNQFGVKASGEQVAQSANMIAKALNGQFGVLEKSGIRFTEAQIAAITFGTEMEKVAAINEGFAQNLKYTNDVALKGTEGQMAKLSVQLENVKEGIGAALIPVVQQLVTALMPVIEKTVAWITANPELTKNIVLAAGAIAGLVTVVGLLGMAIPAIVAGFTALAGPLGIIIAIIAALGYAIYNIVQIMQMWKNDSDMIILGVKTYWLEFVNHVKTKVVQPIKTFFSEMWEGIKKIFSTGVDYLTHVFDPIFAIIDKVKGAISAAFTAVKDGAGYVADKITGKRASGGSVMSNNAYIVGERGPEIFTPSVSGSILPNGAMAGAGGGITVNINGGMYLSEAAANEMGDMIIDRFLRANRG